MEELLGSIKRGETPIHTPKSTSRISVKPEEIDISTLEITDQEEALKIAQIVLQVLEEDLFEANQQGRFGKPIQRHHSDPNLERDRRKKWLQEHESKYSLVSNVSSLDFKLNAPSTMELFYRKGANPRQHERLQKLPEDGKKDESIQVEMHRTEFEGSKLKAVGTQTLETIGLRGTEARLEFMKMYPAPDHWTHDGISSRNASLADITRKLEESSQQEHEIPVGPKPQYRKANRERILKPIDGEFQKAEAYWTGSSFKGDFKDRVFSLGLYNYPTCNFYFYSSSYYLMTFPLQMSKMLNPRVYIRERIQSWSYSFHKTFWARYFPQRGYIRGYLEQRSFHRWANYVCGWTQV